MSAIAIFPGLSFDIESSC